MSTATKSPRKDSLVMYVAIAFIVGFVSGAAFAVFKLGDTSGSGAVAPQESNISEQERQAIAHLEKDVTASPEKFQSWTQLGNLYYDTGQYEKAVKAYERSLELHSGDANIWTDLGVMYRRTGNPPKAIEAFDKAIAMDPAHETSRFNKGVVLMYDLNDTAGAIESWENLLKINPAATASNGESIREFVDQLKEDLAKAAGNSATAK